jgi:hypothetical protein
VKELKVGRVRAMNTLDFTLQRKTEYPTSSVQIVPGEAFSLQFSSPSTVITMYPVCWIVNVDSILDNVEEESKWLIDVAVIRPRPRRQPLHLVVFSQLGSGACGSIVLDRAGKSRPQDQPRQVL